MDDQDLIGLTALKLRVEIRKDRADMTQVLAVALFMVWNV